MPDRRSTAKNPETGQTGTGIGPLTAIFIGDPDPVFPRPCFLAVRIRTLRLASTRGIRSSCGRIFQPIAHSDLRQTPKLCMQFTLVPPRRVPPEGQVPIELHQLASVKDA